jgi:secreted PhoX family phosphatase
MGGAVAASTASGAAVAWAAPTPTISAVTFTAPAGASLDNPEGVTTNNNGTVEVANTEDNVVASISGGATTTVAGSYEGYGETGDGGPATSATLDAPAGLAEDAAGDLFIADTADNVVRKVTPSGTISLVAGNGTEGDSGDGGPATSAELDNPQGVAVDAAGDVFIADTYNNVIREVTPDGNITTLAGNGTPGYSGDGGPAAQAELASPTDVAVDSQGNLYIADAGNNVIRRVSTTGVITTVAGDYAADQATDGLGGFSGDGGPATLAQLNSPQGIAIDRTGDLFIADTFNDAIREVSPAGIISTIVNTSAKPGKAGNDGAATAATLNSPYAVAVDDSTGDLYIADTSNNAIRMVTGLPVPSTTGAGPVAPSGPPASTPEAPVTAALPLAALAVVGGVFGLRRRRQHRRGRA